MPKRRGTIHCYTGIDARLGVLCKRRGVKLTAYTRAIFATTKDEKCKLIDELECGFGPGENI